MTKKIFIIFFFFPLLAKTQDTPVQEIEEKIYNNQFSIGVNHNPLFYLNAMSNNFPVNYHLGYKRRINSRYFLRTALNLQKVTRSSKPPILGGGINIGVERNALFGKNKFKFLYGVDIVTLSDRYIDFGITIGPVVGLEYFIKPRFSLLTEISMTTGRSFGGTSYTFFHRFLGVIINYYF